MHRRVRCGRRFYTIDLIIVRELTEQNTRATIDSSLRKHELEGPLLSLDDDDHDDNDDERINLVIGVVVSADTLLWGRRTARHDKGQQIAPRPHDRYNG